MATPPAETKAAAMVDVASVVLATLTTVEEPKLSLEVDEITPSLAELCANVVEPVWPVYNNWS
jgi:hypothetical protein